jgi:hypothetical protein
VSAGAGCSGAGITVATVSEDELHPTITLVPSAARIPRARALYCMKMTPKNEPLSSCLNMTLRLKAKIFSENQFLKQQVGQ